MPSASWTFTTAPLIHCNFLFPSQSTRHVAMQLNAAGEVVPATPPVGSLQTYCVLSPAARAHAMFTRVLPTHVVASSSTTGSARNMQFNFTSVLSTQFDLPHALIDPLILRCAKQRLPGAIVLAAPDSTSQSTVLGLVRDVVESLFAATPGSRLAYLSLVEAKGSVLIDVLTKRRIHHVNDAEEIETRPVTCQTDWSRVLERFSVRYSCGASIDDAIMVATIRLDNGSRLAVCDIGTSPQMLSTVTLILRSILPTSDPQRTAPPHIPATYVLEPLLPPGNLLHLVVLPDPSATASSAATAARLLHFASALPFHPTAVSSAEHAAQRQRVARDSTDESTDDASGDPLPCVAPPTRDVQRRHAAASQQQGSVTAAVHRPAPPSTGDESDEWVSVTPAPRVASRGSKVAPPQELDALSPLAQQFLSPNDGSQGRRRGQRGPSPPRAVALPMSGGGSRETNAPPPPMGAASTSRVEEVRHLRRLLSEADDDATTARKQIAALEAELARARRLNDELQAVLSRSEAKFAASDEQLAASRLEFAEMSDLLRKLTTRLTHQQAEAAAARNGIAASAETVEQLQETNRQLAEEVTQLTRRIRHSEAKERERVRQVAMQAMIERSRPLTPKRAVGGATSPVSSRRQTPGTAEAEEDVVRLRRRVAELETKLLQRTSRDDHLAAAADGQLPAVETLRGQLAATSAELRRVQDERNNLQRLLVSSKPSAASASGPGLASSGGDVLMSVCGALTRGLDEMLAQSRSASLSLQQRSGGDQGDAAAAKQQLAALDGRVKAVEKLKASIGMASMKPSSAIIPAVARTDDDANSVAQCLKSEIERLAHIKALLPAYSQLCRTFEVL